MRPIKTENSPVLRYTKSPASHIYTHAINAVNPVNKNLHAPHLNSTFVYPGSPHLPVKHPQQADGELRRSSRRPSRGPRPRPQRRGGGFAATSSLSLGLSRSLPGFPGIPSGVPVSSLLVIPCLPSGGRGSTIPGAVAEGHPHSSVSWGQGSRRRRGCCGADVREASQERMLVGRRGCWQRQQSRRWRGSGRGHQARRGCFGGHRRPSWDGGGGWSLVSPVFWGCCCGRRRLREG